MKSPPAETTSSTCKQRSLRFCLGARACRMLVVTILVVFTVTFSHHISNALQGSNTVLEEEPKSVGAPTTPSPAPESTIRLFEPVWDVPLEPARYEKPSSSIFIRFEAPLNQSIANDTNTVVLASDFGGYHTTSLTHVLVFIRNVEDLQRFAVQMDVEWREKSPCNNWLEVFHGKCKSVLQTPKKPHLVVFVPENLNFTGNVKKQYPGMDCFANGGKLNIARYNPKQQHPLTRLILGEDCNLPGDELGYVLWMTPGEIKPLRTNWLTTLSRSLLFPVPLAWAVVPFHWEFPYSVKAELGVFRLSHDSRNNSPRRCSRRDLPLAANTLARFYGNEISKYLDDSDTEQMYIVNRFSSMIFNRFREDAVFDMIRHTLAHRIVVTRLLGNGQEESRAVLGSKSPSAAEAKPLIEHKHWLSHLVFALPDVPNQLNSLKVTLSKWWKKFPPCRNARQEYSLLESWQANTCSPQSTIKKPTLVFMVSRRMQAWEENNVWWKETRKAEKEIQQRVETEVVSLLTSEMKSCFSQVEICVVSFPRNLDSYLTGSRLLFERMLQGKCARGGSHALYIEPDARPVQAGWFTAFSSQVVYPNPNNFITGAIFHGAQTFDYRVGRPFLFYHFNGNAVYQLAQNPNDLDMDSDELRMMDLAEYYLERVKPHVGRRSSVRETAMDWDLADFAFAAWADYREVAATQRFVEHARYTELLSNMYHTKWDFTQMRDQGKAVQLVHGGWCSGDPECMA